MIFGNKTEDVKANVIIIIPTYNERGDVGPLIEALHTEFGSIRHHMGVLVVDGKRSGILVIPR